MNLFWNKHLFILSLLQTFELNTCVQNKKLFYWSFLVIQKFSNCLTKLIAWILIKILKLFHADLDPHRGCYDDGIQCHSKFRDLIMFANFFEVIAQLAFVAKVVIPEGLENSQKGNNSLEVSTVNIVM